MHIRSSPILVIEKLPNYRSANGLSWTENVLIRINAIIAVYMAEEKSVLSDPVCVTAKPFWFLDVETNYIKLFGSEMYIVSFKSHSIVYAYAVALFEVIDFMNAFPDKLRIFGYVNL